MQGLGYPVAYGSLTTIHLALPSGPTNCADPGKVPLDGGEATLDAEWTSAAAQAAIEIRQEYKFGRRVAGFTPDSSVRS